MPQTLRQLLEEPFGPFLDSDVLSENLKSTRTKLLELSNVVLYKRGRVTGLTFCERYQPEYDGLGSDDVQIEGTLTILKLDWLSSSGKDQVEDLLRARDGLNSKITLEGLYGRGRHANSTLFVKIRLQCTKSMAAVYLHSKHIPNGLFMKTIDRDRYYEIVSMRQDTYISSQLYLSRYKALRVIKDIVQFDSKHSESPTPLKERSPTWFVHMYRRYMHHRRKTGDSAVHLSSDSSEDDDERTYPTRPTLNGAIRHRTGRDILALFTKHIQWLISDQRGRRHIQDRYFDPDEWLVFSRIRNRTYEDLDIDMDTFLDDGDIEYESTPPEDDDHASTDTGPSDKAKGKRKAGTRFSSREESGISTTPGRSASPNFERSSSVEFDRRSYDSDFSEASTANWSDSSENSLPSRPPTPPTPTLAKDIPLVFLHPPCLPRFSFTWMCPVDGCAYEIDLLNLSEENSREVHEDDLRRIKRGGWTLQDEWLQNCFGWMVSVHWSEHLENRGIIIEEDGGIGKPRWKHPESHPSSNSATSRQPRPQQIFPVVKRETDYY
ncbi:hypothetical protein C8Q75DRAFT_887201 [Abortiporus biennis]|nr:hypothetical protein C8Q75DRAFT_887201 [Abortiporus biennis]